MKTIKFGKNALIYSPLCFLLFIYPAPYFLLFAIGIRQNHISIKSFLAFLFFLSFSKSLSRKIASLAGENSGESSEKMYL